MLTLTIMYSTMTLLSRVLVQWLHKRRKIAHSFPCSLSSYLNCTTLALLLNVLPLQNMFYHIRKTKNLSTPEGLPITAKTTDLGGRSEQSHAVAPAR